MKEFSGKCELKELLNAALVRIEYFYVEYNYIIQLIMAGEWLMTVD